MPPRTNEELDDFKEEVRRGFSKVSDEIQNARADITARQDRTNGRVDKQDERHYEMMRVLSTHGEAMAALTENVKGLNKEVFGRSREVAAAAVVVREPDPQLAEVIDTLKSLANGMRDVNGAMRVGRVVWSAVMFAAPVGVVAYLWWWATGGGR